MVLRGQQKPGWRCRGLSNSRGGTQQLDTQPCSSPLGTATPTLSQGIRTCKPGGPLRNCLSQGITQDESTGLPGLFL